MSDTLVQPRPLDLAEVKPSLSERDLAEILQAFNDVTGKLHTAHESLRAEVARLQGELRQANEQLERSKRLAALGEMAAGIAHEVRNPLGGIRLYATMLMDDLKDRPSERTLAEKIAAATRGLDAIVCDVLAFAREMRVQPQPTLALDLLNKAIDEAVASDRAEQRSGRACTPVQVHRDEGLGDVAIECDPALIHRALVNVIRNAIQAMREHASVHADARCTLSVSVERRLRPESAASSAPCVALVIRDSGPGIPPEVMERMFNPFFTTRATGTGLGLAIVHRIVDAHSGWVVVKNASGEETGAVVELILPEQSDLVSENEHTRGMVDARTASPAPHLPEQASKHGGSAA